MSWFVLELDTAAPEVGWDAPATVRRGGLLEVGYLLDEPGVLDATLVLSDLTELPMTVGPGALTAPVPAGAALGPATVRATLRDEVWNQATALSPPVWVVGPEGPPEGETGWRLLSGGGRGARVSPSRRGAATGPSGRGGPSRRGSRLV